jgi:hypothetical protein
VILTTGLDLPAGLPGRRRSRKVAGHVAGVRPVFECGVAHGLSRLTQPLEDSGNLSSDLSPACSVTPPSDSDNAEIRDSEKTGRASQNRRRR